MNQACDVAPDELIAFTEEELPEGRMKTLEAHVPTCPACQERLTGARETMNLLRETLPELAPHSRHDLLVRLYQEAGQQTDHPHRSWTQVASLTAVGGMFLIAAVMLWSGIGQLVDSIPRPFQQASPDQLMEWVSDDDEAAAMFNAAPMPNSVGDRFPIYDWRVRSGIRVIAYQDGDGGQMAIEISQFFVDPETDAPPGYMAGAGAVNGTEIFVDDPDFIHEVRWSDGDIAHHLQFHALDTSDQQHLTLNDAERIVRAFLEEERSLWTR